MRQYRLYCLDGTRRITSSHEIAAENDDEAIVLARKMKLGVTCELWERERMVAQLDSHQDR